MTNNNDKENNKPITSSRDPTSSIFKSKFVDSEKPSKQVIESSLPPEKTATSIVAPPVGSAPVPVAKPAVVASRVQPVVVPEVVTAEVIKPSEAVTSVSAVSAIKAVSPIHTANSFTAPGGWNSAIITKPPTLTTSTEKTKIELTLEERVSFYLHIEANHSKNRGIPFFFPD